MSRQLTDTETDQLDAILFGSLEQDSLPEGHQEAAYFHVEDLRGKIDEALGDGWAMDNPDDKAAAVDAVMAAVISEASCVLLDR